MFDFLHYFASEALPTEATQPLRDLRRDLNTAFRSARHIVRGRQDDCNCWKGLACFPTPAFERAHLEARLTQYAQPPMVDYMLPRASLKPPLQSVSSQWESDKSEAGGEWFHSGMRHRPLAIEPPPYIQIQSNDNAENNHRSLEEGLYSFLLVLYCKF